MLSLLRPRWQSAKQPGEPQLPSRLLRQRLLLLLRPLLVCLEPPLEPGCMSSRRPAVAEAGVEVLFG